MVVTLFVLGAVGCTKAAPPPQPPAEDASPPDMEEPAEEQEQVMIDQNTRIDGPLTEAQVDAVVQEHFNETKKCFDDALMRMEADDLTGAIAVRMEVDGSGAVTEAVVEASNFGDEETPQCIVADVQGWTFPGSKKGEGSSVVYPFFLRSY